MKMGENGNLFCSKIIYFHHSLCSVSQQSTVFGPWGHEEEDRKVKRRKISEYRLVEKSIGAG